jgi:hypothetical protein
MAREEIERVVGLPGIGEHAGLAGRVDDRGPNLLSSLGLLPPVSGSKPGGEEVAPEVDPDDDVPLLLGEVDQCPVP